MDTALYQPAALLPIARFVGIVAPTLYAGVTAQCEDITEGLRR